MLAMHTALAGAAACLLTGAMAVARAQTLAPPEPEAAASAIVAAFKAHDLVALSDAHGNAQAQDFLRALVRAPGFADAVNDIVIEFGSARYQPIVDRYIRGEDVPLRSVQPAWQNAVTPNQIWADEGFFEAVRTVNASRPPGRRIRVLLGDPPIDWATVRTREDHFRWVSMRDSFPAALIQVEVLAQQRKALVVYGHLHFQRRQIASNFDMSDWRTQTIVSLIEHASPHRVFAIWRLDDQLAAIIPETTAWTGPRLVRTRGNRLGAADVALLSPPTAGRMQIKGGALVPLPRDQWRAWPIEEQLDAVLYLGPGAAMTAAPVPARACAEPGFVEERLRRIAVAGIPAFEADRVKQICSAR